jgi:RNA polymerase sigma-70 factor (ECF subfamily)
MSDGRKLNASVQEVSVNYEEHRAYLTRYAALQIRDAAAVEDLVQETLLAAVAGRDRFSGNSSIKTWLTGILKHKIIDHLRRQNREQPLLGDGDADRNEAEAVDALFAADGHWQDRPSHWGDPHRAFENRQFWEVFERCSQLMPARMARVFTMREVLDLPTEDICKELGISATNCWVMLHRARLILRECLETRWFANS